MKQLLHPTALRLLPWCLLLLVLNSTSGSAQLYASAEGTLVSAAGESREIELLSTRFKYTPDVIRYQYIGNATERIATPTPGDVVVVQDRIKFRAARAVIDTTSDLDPFRSLRVAGTRTETAVWLTALVEGAVSLYELRRKSYTRYYYSTGGEREPLILLEGMYALSGTERNQQALRSREYLKQLASTATCYVTAPAYLAEVAYEAADLTRVVEEINACLNSPHVTYRGRVREKFMSVAAAAGVSSSRLTIPVDVITTAPPVERVFDLGTQVTYIVGLDLTLHIQQTDRRFGFVISPRYTTYAGADSFAVSSLGSGSKGYATVAGLNTIVVPVLAEGIVYRNRSLTCALRGGFAMTLPIGSRDTWLTLRDNPRTFLLAPTFYNANRAGLCGELRVGVRDRFFVSATYAPARSLSDEGKSDLNLRQFSVMGQVKLS